MCSAHADLPSRDGHQRFKFGDETPAVPPFVPRIWSGDSGEPDDPGLLTLRGAFNRFVLPSLDSSERSRSGTLEAYSNALNHWERLTNDPAVREIDTAVLNRFRKGLEEVPLAPATVAKILRQIRPILRRCGPATDGNPRGAGVIATVPWVESPRVGRKAPRNATFEELNQLYEACRVAVWPHVPDVPAPAFWRALIVGLHNLGPRAWEILHDGGDEKAGWFWENLTLGGRSPTGAQLSQVKFLQPKTGNELLLPVGPVLVAHLESIRGRPGDRRAMFPVTLAHGSVYGQWRAIKAAAGVGVEGHADLDFHDLRRTCQTEWDFMKLGLGDFILGHAARDVGGTFYRNFSRYAFEMCEQLPQPEAFQTIFQRVARESQQRVF